jgi:hypothetical protein
MARAMLPGLMNMTRMSASGGMEIGDGVGVRGLVGGAAIRPAAAHHVLLAGVIRALRSVR